MNKTTRISHLDTRSRLVIGASVGDSHALPLSTSIVMNPELLTSVFATNTFCLCPVKNYVVVPFLFFLYSLHMYLHKTVYTASSFKSVTAARG